jgi:hypothetical protein
MNTTIEERKQKAIEYMNKLKIYKPYITGFEKENDVCYFEGFGGFWAWQDEELTAKIKEIEKEHNCTVYAVTHELTDFGEIYDLLVVTDYKDEWDDLLYNNYSCFYAFAYCWNKSDDYCSEFGTIAIQSFGGGIRRIG